MTNKQVFYIFAGIVLLYMAVLCTSMLADHSKKIKAVEKEMSNFRSCFEAVNYQDIEQARQIIRAYEADYQQMQKDVEMVRQLLINYTLIVSNVTRKDLQKIRAAIDPMRNSLIPEVVE